MPTDARQVVRLIRGCRTARILGDGLTLETRYVLDGVTGQVVFPVPSSLGDAEHLVICIPDESPEFGPEVQLLLEMKEPEAGGGLGPRERWEAWFGKSHPARWISGQIDTAKLDGRVVDDALELVNRFASIETEACTLLNRDPARLAGACARVRGRATPGAFAVAVDPDGVDVRTIVSNDPMRVEVPEWEVVAGKDALDAMRRWLG